MFINYKNAPVGEISAGAFCVMGKDLLNGFFIGKKREYKICRKGLVRKGVAPL